MIVVREVFVAKPGMASKLATFFKAEMGREAKVMTDMTGSFNTVVMEAEYESVGAFEREMQEYMNKPKTPSDAPKSSYQEMYTHGKREIFRVW